MADMTTAEAPRTAPRAEARSPVPVRREPEGRTSAPVRRPSRALLRYALFALGGLVLIIGGGWYWLSGGRYVSTSDAYVQANVLTVSTDVSGVVDQILVHEGERVKQGQVLFRLDPDKFRIALENARANLAQIDLNLNALKSDYRRAESQVAAQAATVQGDQATYDRDAILVKQNAIPRQRYDDARFKLASDQAAQGAAEAEAKGTLAKLGGNPEAPVANLPSYKQAAAQLAEAQREFDHSVVRAPFDGVVTQVNKLQTGQFLPAGTAAFGLVESDHLWVAAQPKETKLTHARAGQEAEVTIDAYPSHTWHGTVQSIAPATDQEFSVLPAQNSSGNWVKVVQRVPVRINIDQRPDDPPLSAGMSAEVTIDTHHHRTLGELF